MLRNLLTTPSYPAWTYTYAMTVLQWMKVTWNDTLHALLIVLRLSESVSICMIISIRLVNNNMCSFYRCASPTWLARCHAADIQEAGFWLLSSPQAWWEQWLVLCLTQLQFSQRLCPSPTVTTVFSTSCLEDYCSSRLMAWEQMPSAITLCGIPQVCNVEQQADCCQWSKIRKIAFYFFYSGFKMIVFERYTQWKFIHFICFYSRCHVCYMLFVPYAIPSYVYTQKHEWHTFQKRPDMLQNASNFTPVLSKIFPTQYSHTTEGR